MLQLLAQMEVASPVAVNTFLFEMTADLTSKYIPDNALKFGITHDSDTFRPFFAWRNNLQAGGSAEKEVVHNPKGNSASATFSRTQSFTPTLILVLQLHSS